MNTTNSTRLQNVSRAASVAALLLLGSQAALAGSEPSMDQMPTEHGEGHSEFQFGRPGDATQADKVIRITMGDMNFDPQSLMISVGQTIRFVVTNRSEIDHDFTIGDAATQGAHRAEMLEAMENGGAKHRNDPNAVLVKAGEQRELVWTFTTAGPLEFDCNVPGHFEAGMRGRITVEKTEAPVS
jgi:uncharacterized cupredoxin-like copper-binding protein